VKHFNRKFWREEITGRRWKNGSIIKPYLVEILREKVELIHLVQVRDKEWAAVNKVMNSVFHEMRELPWPIERPLVSREGLYSME
jgi:hypothetical protein